MSDLSIAVSALDMIILSISVKEKRKDANFSRDSKPEVKHLRQKVGSLEVANDARQLEEQISRVGI